MLSDSIVTTAGHVPETRKRDDVLSPHHCGHPCEFAGEGDPRVRAL